MHFIAVCILFIAALGGALLYDHAEAPAEVALESAVHEETATTTGLQDEVTATPEGGAGLSATTTETASMIQPEDSEEATETSEQTTTEKPIVPAPVPQEPIPVPTEVNPPVVVSDEKPRVSEPLVVAEQPRVSSVPLPDLHAQGVLGYTNAARYKNGLPLYTANTTLDRIALRKLRDMFERQYFAHDAPDGKDVSDLANIEGYDYLLIGENLAVGGFRDNEHLVDAWLDSPGHRANILSSEFIEIGIAVGRGVYEGDDVWMAVQTFGLPHEACPAPETSLLLRIEEDDQSLEDLALLVAEQKQELQSTRQSSPLFRERYETYLSTAALYNELVEEQRDLVETYNTQVGNYNDCLEDLRP